MNSTAPHPDIPPEAASRDLLEETAPQPFDLPWPPVLQNYLKKMAGQGISPPAVNQSELLWSWIGSFLGISLVGLLHQFWLSPQDLSLLIGSFGASAVLVYSAITSPLAQPRNLVGGHFFSALVGVAMLQIFGAIPWLAAAMAVSVAIVVMLATRTLHPPGGATALIAVIGSPELHSLGYLYALVPAAAGAVIMLLVALAVNNIPGHRRYPLYWW